MAEKATIARPYAKAAFQYAQEESNRLPGECATKTEEQGATA